MEKALNVSQGAITGAADSVIVKLNYTYTVANLFDISSAFDHVLRLNDAFDPDATGFGDQPVGFDQWSAFYSRNKVLKCKATFEAAATGVNIAMAMYPKSTNTGPDNIREVISNPRSQWKVVSFTGPAQRIEKTFDIRELFGLTPAQFGDDDYTGTSSSSPAQQYFLWIHGSVVGGTTGGSNNLQGYVKLEYTIQFFDRTDLDLSFLLKEREMYEKYLRSKGLTLPVLEEKKPKQ